MYISLYRRYRPQKFSEMVGQSAAVSVLREALKEGHLGHAYLFSGPRGCGKTSAARLVAKGLNCQNLGTDGEPCGECEACSSIAQGEHLDVIEIDGASNRGINEIRDLKSHVNLKPLIAPYKVYIIDEVHMLTEAAFNALLKTLEEPPANVVFLLATTEPHKVPVTIRSRCQHIPFHRISMADMVTRVAYVCATENIQADMEAVWEISRQADGALRDALSLTEQAVSLGKGNLTLESVKALTGGSNRTELEKWVINLRLDPKASNAALHEMLGRGISVERLTESLFAVFRDMWIFSLWGEKGMEALEISEEEGKFLREETPHWSAEKLRSACIFCNRLLPRARYGMRMEVFSGLIMLELVNIIEGKNETVYSVREGIKPKERNRSPETEQPKPESMVRQTEPSVNNNKQGSETAAEAPPAQTTEAVSFEELSDKNYAKLLSKLGNRGIAIGAALLNCGIQIENSEWKFITNVHSPSHTYLMVPQNRKLLSKALEELWGAKDPAGKENSAALPENLPVENRVGEDTSNLREKAQKGSLISDTDRIIKLLGAEVLYVKDANGDSETDDFGSTD
ncbi:MAG: DNA polymerase III subunit gamma/tau [Synergistaceae bacterium]|jgi:DNA polymerase-3 subunit gamma/tau|nr:DNA polymerase III subunit gamma/tau [Synergistaceae bacterium]MCK9437547.1 DNA polymerase III subunit gamma/tau [Synergistaceae bacterium]MDD2350796.1 DNA polymerase III subunit gamma/tau [Synergistaceae bacterium]MDD3319159.1 DNA polymerase III subunit gamma/tau [Synergistaceae bacterium]MDD3672562.1 DNA polymerase III subunit gamma/tau [Synergistaceae bacterium]